MSEFDVSPPAGLGLEDPIATAMANMAAMPPEMSRAEAVARLRLAAKAWESAAHAMYAAADRLSRERDGKRK